MTSELPESDQPDQRRQSQQSGDNSQNFQAGRDINITQPDDATKEEPLIQRARLDDVKKYDPHYQTLKQAIIETYSLDRMEQRSDQAHLLSCIGILIVIIVGIISYLILIFGF